MSFIDRHKALLITILLMGIVILSLYNIHMVQIQQGYNETMIELPEEFLQEDKVEEESIVKEDRTLISARRTHDAYNEDFEDPEADHAFEERIKALKGLTDFTNEEGTIENSTTEEEQNKESDHNLEEERKPLEDKETNNRNTSLSFRLKDRKAVDLPNPVYTCQRSGKVVVKIEVNQNGYVIHTKVDKKQSTTRNECLFDNALHYAKSALFSPSPTALKTQKGIITYFFNYAE